MVTWRRRNGRRDVLPPFPRPLDNRRGEKGWRPCDVGFCGSRLGSVERVDQSTCLPGPEQTWIHELRSQFSISFDILD